MEPIKKLLSKNKKTRVILVSLPAILLCIAGLAFAWQHGFRYHKNRAAMLRTLHESAFSKEGAETLAANEYQLSLKGESEIIKAPVTRQEIEGSLQKYPRATGGVVKEAGFAQGGVVPHHLLASDLIAEFFSSVSKHVTPRRFIIIGPNHPDAGIFKITTGRNDWETVYGNVASDQSVVAAAEKLSFVGEDVNVLTHEHSVYTLIPFIRVYFPEATVVPFAISSDITTTELNDFVEALKPFIDEKTFVIASVDFSHYLSSDSAKEKDNVMRKLMEERSYNTMRGLQSDFLDSPASLITTMRLTEESGASEIKIIKNVTSADIIGQPLDSSTSYFTILFTRPTSSIR